MKHIVLQLHKEVVLLCEEGMTPIEAQNALLVPKKFKSTTTTKTQMELRRIGKHCTNCGEDNHNVVMCRIKKEKPIIVTKDATNHLKRFRRIIRMFTTFEWA